MKVLLLYPEYPKDTFWSFEYALKFVGRKAGFPPLGLLTIAAMLPQNWELELVDMNAHELTDEQIAWADVVFISAMIAQRESVKAVIPRCKKLGKKIVCGGPLFTTGYRHFPEVDHLVLGEAEDIMPGFLRDLAGGQAKRIYASDPEHRPDIGVAPIPRWDLIDVRDYAALSIQFSRGCPFHCEFCDIVIVSGNEQRSKIVEQFIGELNAIYRTGHRGPVFIVDDNFIGNKANAKFLLPEIVVWQKRHGFPFAFSTEASINLADDDGLIAMMVQAGFTMVFIGLETPSKAALESCGKMHNVRRDLLECVRKIQRAGLQVDGGFIVGFDTDTEAIFDEQISLIQQAGVWVAMVGILQALPGTLLHKRLTKEGRLLSEPATGNNSDGSLSFLPKLMDCQTLLDGFARVIRTIYSPRECYKTICNFLREYRRPPRMVKLRGVEIMAFFRSVWHLGIRGEAGSKRYYWKALGRALFRNPRALPEVVIALIYGNHFRKIAEKKVAPSKA